MTYIGPRSYFDDVKEFHEALNIPVGTPPWTDIDNDRVHLRHDLLWEEYSELIEALHANDRVEIADGIADLVVVALGTAVEFGIDFEAVWQAVHRSNMAKQGGPVREDGKVLKPEGWRPPNIAPIVGAEDSNA